MPTTSLGRLGAMLTGLGLAGWILFVVVNDALQGLGSPWRLLALLLSQVALVGGGVLCAVAVARRGERAPLVYAALVPAALMVLLILAEVTGLME